MIASGEAEQIAGGWVSEYSSAPNIAKIDRERPYFFELDSLIYHRPSDALVVFEKVAGMDLTDWALEGFSAGPIRTFLHLYGDGYNSDLDAISRRTPLFADLRALAIEGL
ncbi:MAG: hypothetical protein JF595_07395 [Sphingomonadales bacterium]|nr:hypothetical protein [Sphingomonadales bacterium]